MSRILAGLLAGSLALATPAAADSLKVMSAGSLRAALTDLLRRFPAGTDTIAEPEFGASGLMRQKIEAGAQADLFTSADMEQPRRLAVDHPERTVIFFTRNSLCAVARPAVGVTTDNLLDRLLDPAVRVATSTPRNDPLGDYTWAMFARADAVKQGARATLESKARKLVGGGASTPPPVAGKGAIEGIFLADQADLMLVYCSESEALQKQVPGLVALPLPPSLNVEPAYGMVVLDPKPVTLRFVAFMMSEQGQTVLRAHDFDPVALAPPAKP
jgi:ABC-type molybdate transport system substrate-binding protein